MLSEDRLAKLVCADFFRKQKFPRLETSGSYFMLFTFDTFCGH